LDIDIIHATNPKDYTYGIVGITGFPAKAISIDGWNTNGHSELYIPIDYKADWNAILCAVTWAAVMKGGLALASLRGTKCVTC
jgi:hypothetical protein